MHTAFSTIRRQPTPSFASFSSPTLDAGEYWKVSEFGQAEVQRVLLQMHNDRARLYILPTIGALDAAISGARYAVQNQSSLDTSSPLDTEAYETFKAMAVKEVGELSARWQKSLLDSQSDSTSKSLAHTAKLIFESIAKFGPASINLTSVTTETVNPMHLAVILRVTKDRKALVPGWDDAREVVADALDLRQLDKSAALVGI